MAFSKPSVIVPRSSIRIIPQGAIARNRGDNAIAIQGHSLSVRQTKEPWQIVYGHCRLGGIYSFITTDVEAGGEWLHQYITYASHLCHGVVGLFLDGQEVTFSDTDENGSIWGWSTGDWAFDPPAANSYVFISALSLGSLDQEANADMLAQSAALFPGKWTENHRQAGHAGVYLIFYFDPIKFPNGNPQIQLEIYGKADIYDPRDDSVGYTNNAALVIADYLTQASWGLGQDYSTEIDLDVLQNSADICAEVITNKDGTKEKRYAINGAFDLSQRPRDILEGMVSAIGGEIIYSSGKWKIYPGYWRPPSITLTLDDVRGPANIRTLLGKKDSFNCVTGTYLDSRTWQIVDFPAVKNSYYETQDGERVIEDITLPFTITSACAQRLAKIQLEKSRQQIVIERLYSIKAMQLDVGDNVAITDETLGFVEKPFQVQDFELLLSDNLECLVKLVLRETASGVWDWNDGEETEQDLAPNTQLPTAADVRPPTNLQLESGTDHLFLRSDGTVFTRGYLTWTFPTTPFAQFFEIQAKRTSASTWNESVLVPGTSSSTYLNDLADGEYIDVRIRSISGIGYKSEWETATGFYIVGKTANPSTPESFLATVHSYGILLTWKPIPDLDVSHYAICLDTWDVNNIYDITAAASWRMNIQDAGTYTFVMRAVDRSGNYSNSVTTVAVIASPGVPTLTFSIVSSDILLSWNEVSSQFAINEYELRYDGDSWNDATFLARTKATSYRQHVDWIGTKKFRIRAIDVAGNKSPSSAVDVIIIPPSAPLNFKSEVIDNNVLFYWDSPLVHSLLIKAFKLYRGDTFATSTLIGEKAGDSSFTTWFESSSGTFTYYLLAVDSAGNVGSYAVTQSFVNQPPDYKLYDEIVLDFGDVDTLTNALIEDNAIICPVDTSITWADHFSDNSWSTVKDQIDDDFLIYIQPANSSPAVIETVIDLGAEITSIIDLSWHLEILDGSVTIASDISYSSDGENWTTVEDVTQVLATFRYWRPTITITTDLAQTGLARISEIRGKLSVKFRNDAGTGTANSGDSGGTEVLFNETFVDIESIWITAKHQSGETKGITAVYDFTDTPNPTGFKVLLYSNNSGNRISGAFSWGARGIVGGSD